MTNPSVRPRPPSSDGNSAEGVRLLEGLGLSRSFPGVRALTDVDVAIRAGTVHFLVGENGAGKSTLVKLLAGVHAPERGQLLLDGRDVTGWNARTALQRGVATVYQEFNLVPHLTVAENVFLGREPGRGALRDRTALRHNTVALLQQFDADIDPDQAVRDLGVAHRQTVEILKALSLGSTRVLMLDEPTAALSARETQSLFATIRRLTARGVGILYISHRLDEVQEIGDEISVMRDGEVVAHRPAQELEHDEMVRLMVGRRLQDLFPPRPRVETASATPALRVEHVSLGSRVRDASLEVARGEVVGLFGLIGAGRTELVRGIVGAERLSSGRVEIDGCPVRLRSPFSAVRAGMGLAPEDRKRSGVVPGRSLGDNILLASLAQSRWGRILLPQRRTRAACEEYRHRLRIKAPSIDSAIDTLSGGNQQKAIIARLLLIDADIVILDEPTRGIDVGAKREVYELIVDLAQSGRAVLIVTSDLEEALGLCNRLLVMRTGVIVESLDVAVATREMVLQMALPASASENAAAA